MFSIKPPKKQYTYVQAWQPSPLEWQIVTPRKGYWQAETQPFRCREYFNDIVAKKYGKKYQVYGFFNSPVRFRKHGIDVLMLNIHNMNSFVQNLDMINQVVEEQLGVTLSYTLDVEEPSKIILNFPLKCWENTYTISALTLALRASCFGIEFSSWEDMFKDGGVVNEKESSWGYRARKYVSKHKLLPPEAFRNFWWHYSAAYNNTNCKQTRYIHNTGAVAWTRSFTEEM